MQTLIDGLCRLFSVLMVVFLGLMVLMVFGNVVLRYGFNSGITMSEELSRWLFVWTTFLGAVVALRQHAHLGTDALLVRLPLQARRGCRVVALLLMLYVCGLTLKGGWAQMQINLGSTSAVMEVSMAWFYAAGVVFAALAIVVLLHQLWRVLTGQASAAELIGMRESEDVAPPGAMAGEQAR